MSKVLGNRFIRALAAFAGTVLLGMLLFGVPFAMMGAVDAYKLREVSGKYPGKDGKPITFLDTFLNVTGAGVCLGGTAAVIPGLFLAAKQFVSKTTKICGP